MASARCVRQICACAAVVIVAADVAAQDGGQEEPVEMSVDISLTHDIVDKDGHPVLPAQGATAFSVMRTRRSGTWQTVVTYRRHGGPQTRASATPLDGARVVLDDATGETRFYNAEGELDPLLTGEKAKTRGLVPDRGPATWLGGLVAFPAARAARAQDLHEAYGNVAGRVRALDRFVRQRGEIVEEVLADPSSALPVEINSIRDGELESHVVLEYERRADGAWVRRRMRAEHRVPGDAGHRRRVAVEFTNLRVGGR